MINVGDIFIFNKKQVVIIINGQGSKENIKYLNYNSGNLTIAELNIRNFEYALAVAKSCIKL